MSQNQEIIESKLCAYIDGDLDADGRTEIEKHLDANPQHRRLLESLKATRDLIKWLPREAAPPELAETLNGQLERSVLLDFDERSLNRNIWPRVLSAAAIVLLTAGLGTAVYFTLPKSQKNATPYAKTDSQSPMPEGTVAEPTPDAAKPDDALTAAAPLMAKSSASVFDNKTEADRTPNSELDRLASDVSQNQAVILATANGAGPAANAPRPISPNAIVMLVHSNSAEQATHDVTRYLESQNIQWKPAPAAASTEPAPTTQGQIVDSVVDAAALRENAVNRDARRVMGAAGGAAAGVAAGAEPATRAEGQRGDGFAALPRAPGSQSLPQDGQSSLQLNQQSASQPARHSFGQNIQSQLSQIGAPGNQPIPAGMYVARMSRRQAIDLSNSVHQGLSQTAELKDLTGTVATAGNFEERSRNQMLGANSGAPQQMQMPKASARIQTSEPATRFGGGYGGGGGLGYNQFQLSRSTTEPTTVTPEAAPTTEPMDAAVDVVIVVQPDAMTTQPMIPPQTEPAASQPAPTTQPAARTRPADH